MCSLNKRTSIFFVICLIIVIFIASLVLLLNNGFLLNFAESEGQFELEPETSGFLWQTDIEHFATGLDASNGNVYTIDIFGTICCYDAYNGKSVWTEGIGGYWGRGVTASHSIVYGGKSGTEVGAVDAKAGKFQWVVGTLSDSAWSKRAPSNITVLEDRLFVTGDDFEVYNATTGELLWENVNNGFNLDSNVTHPAWIVAWPFEGNRLFGVGGVVNVGYFIYRLDADTGTVLWNRSHDPIVRETPVLYGTQLIMRNSTDEKTTVFSLDENRGDLLWSYDVDAEVFQPVAYNGLLFFGASDDSFYALHLANGTLAWKSQVDSQNITSWVNVDNPLEGLPIQIDLENQRIVSGFAVTTQILVNDTREDDDYWGIICSLDIETGNVAWTKHFQGEDDISNDYSVYGFALTENNIYLTTINDFRIFSKTTGHLIESQSFEHTLSSPVAENGKVFVAADLWLIAYDN